MQKLHITFERDFTTIQEDLQAHYEDWKDHNPELDVKEDHVDLTESLLWDLGGFEYYLWDEVHGNQIIPHETIEEKVHEFVQKLLF